MQKIPPPAKAASEKPVTPEQGGSAPCLLEEAELFDPDYLGLPKPADEGAQGE